MSRHVVVGDGADVGAGLVGGAVLVVAGRVGVDGG
jgi:hypothetical protein